MIDNSVENIMDLEKLNLRRLRVSLRNMQLGLYNLKN